MAEDKFQTGDFIAFQSSDVPLPEVQAVVIEDNGDTVEVLSTLLVPFQHSGTFKRSEMKNLMLVYPAGVAVPRESRRDWRRGQLLRVTKGPHENVVAPLLAAFDGVCVCKVPDFHGKWLTGGAAGFEKALMAEDVRLVA